MCHVSSKTCKRKQITLLIVNSLLLNRVFNAHQEHTSYNKLGWQKVVLHWTQLKPGSL